MSTIPHSFMTFSSGVLLFCTHKQTPPSLCNYLFVSNMLNGCPLVVAETINSMTCSSRATAMCLAVLKQ